MLHNILKNIKYWCGSCKGSANENYSVNPISVFGVTCAVMHSSSSVRLSPCITSSKNKEYLARNFFFKIFLQIMTWVKIILTWSLLSNTSYLFNMLLHITSNKNVVIIHKISDRVNVMIISQQIFKCDNDIQDLCPKISVCFILKIFHDTVS